MRKREQEDLDLAEPLVPDGSTQDKARLLDNPTNLRTREYKEYATQVPPDRYRLIQF